MKSHLHNIVLSVFLCFIMTLLKHFSVLRILTGFCMMKPNDFVIKKI